jgi:hypothetical protein
MPHARNLFETMPTAEDEAKSMFMEGLIYHGIGGMPYDPEETQSQDGRAPYMPFRATLDSIEARPVSGIGMKDMVCQHACSYMHTCLTKCLLRHGTHAYLSLLFLCNLLGLSSFGRLQSPTWRDELHSLPLLGDHQ